MNIAFDWHEVNVLIRVLNAQGVSYLMGSEEASGEDDEAVDPIQLLQRLASCGYPLVQDACISLFILHPELTPSVVTALQSSEQEVAETLAVLILATLYLQQWWIFRLAFALGRLPSFPDAPFVSLWETRALPSPSAGYGLDGLLALQEYQQRRSGLPLNFLHDWQNQINHLILQEQAHYRQPSVDLIRTLKQISENNELHYLTKERTA